MIFEDLHWADPSSRELLDIPIEQIGRLPVLLVATFRSRLQAPKSGVAFQRFSKERDRFMRPAEHEFCDPGDPAKKKMMPCSRSAGPIEVHSMLDCRRCLPGAAKEAVATWYSANSRPAHRRQDLVCNR